MCYTIEKNLTRDQLEKRFGSKLNTERPYSPGKRVSGFEFPDVPVLLAGGNMIEIYNWGLIPFWTSNLENARQIRIKTLNAKCETLLKKPSFRNLVKNKRCLVLTNGFYEWQHAGKTKIPYLIRLKDDIAVPMAGLYDKWVDKNTGEIFNTFTIITTHANQLMERIHNTKKRMPVILSQISERDWIDPGLTDKKALEMLTPCDNEMLNATEVQEKNNSLQTKLF